MSARLGGFNKRDLKHIIYFGALRAYCPEATQNSYNFVAGADAGAGSCEL